MIGKISRSILRTSLLEEAEKQGHKLTDKEQNDILDSVIDSIKMTASEYFVEDIEEAIKNRSK